MRRPRVYRLGPVMLGCMLGLFTTIVAMTAAASASGRLAEGGSHHAQSCGRVAPAFATDITATGVSCPAARRFVAAVSAHRATLKVHDTSYDGYHCHPRQVGAAGWAIRCSRGARVIRWSSGT